MGSRGKHLGWNSSSAISCLCGPGQVTLCLSFLIYEKGTAAQPHKVAGIIKRVTRCKGVFGAVSTECHVCAVAFPGGTVVTNLPGSAGDARDAGSVPGLGRSLGVNAVNKAQGPTENWKK